MEFLNESPLFAPSLNDGSSQINNSINLLNESNSINYSPLLTNYTLSNSSPINYNQPRNLIHEDSDSSCSSFNKKM